MLVGKANSGSRYWVSFAVLQQTAVLPDVISYNAAFCSSGNAQQWQQALDLLAVIQQTAVLPDVISYSAVISSCGDGKQWQLALCVWVLSQLIASWIFVPSIPPSTLERRANNGADLGLFGGDTAGCCSPNAISFSAVICACNKGKQWRQALGLCAAMQQTAMLPIVISYSAVISTWEKGQLWQQALGGLPVMQLTAFLTGVISLAAVIEFTS